MFASYVTSALRALKRDKFHAALNISGLAVSLAAALLIALYIQHELSYENFFTQPDRVYRVEITYQNKGQPAIRFTGSPVPVKEVLNDEFPSLLTATSIITPEMVVTAGETRLRVPVTFTDKNFFNVLDFPVIAGDADAALTNPGNAVLTETMALRFFGTKDAVGKTLRLGPNADFRVAAIMADLPGNTSFRRMGVLVSEQSPISLTQRPEVRSWGRAMVETFIRLKDGVRPEDVSQQLQGIIDRHVHDAIKALTTVSLSLRALPDIHLTAGESGLISDQNQTALYALGATGVFLVLIACFNYINLTTARALLRVKEVGMRKILGGTTRQLVTQFFGETIVTTLIAFILALGLAALTLPVFASLVNRELTFALLATSNNLIWMVALFLVVGLTAGTYPALYLASSEPMSLFQNRKSSTGGHSLLRSAMVGTQFSLTVGLIIAATVVYGQVNYLRNFDLGFNKEGLLMISHMPTGDEAGRGEAYLAALMQSPYITATSAGDDGLRPDYEGNTVLRRAGNEDNPLLALQYLQVGYGYFDLLGLKPLAGRLFSHDFNDALDFTQPDMPSQSSVIISESSVAYFGFASPKDALGQFLKGPFNNRPIDYKIVGVVPDFHFRLAHAPRKPAVFFLIPKDLATGMARVAPGGDKAALDYARDTWNRMFPQQPFSYEFLDDVIDRANADDARHSELFTFFTGLAIVVACLGLFGLASFVAARRTQEIAIRKVLGASTANVTRLLLWDFAKPVLAANIVAWPIAWLVMRQWLNGFPYRVDLSPAFFIGASAVALAIALLTVMSRTLKAAGTRPAAALKYE